MVTLRFNRIAEDNYRKKGKEDGTENLKFNSFNSCGPNTDNAMGLKINLSNHLESKAKVATVHRYSPDIELRAKVDSVLTEQSNRPAG